MNSGETIRSSEESDEIEQKTKYIKIGKGASKAYDQVPENDLVDRIEITAQNADEGLRNELEKNEDIYSSEEQSVIVETSKHVSFGTSFPENAIAFYLAKTESAVTQRSRPDWLKNPDTERSLEVDIFIDPPGVGIEYDGWRYHQDLERDVKKDQIAREHGYRIIHIREKGCPELPENSICIERNNNRKTSDLSECIRKCCQFLGVPELDIDVGRDKKDIEAFMQKTILEKLKSIDILIELGYEEDDAKDIASSIALSDFTLFGNIYRNFVFLQELGYSQDDVIKMTKALPAIYSLSIDNMKQKITDMQGLGYTRDDVIKMTKSLPAIYNLSIDNMKQKITDMQELGYSQDDVIKMAKTLPAIYGFSIDNMKQKITDMQELGYSQDDVIKMTKTLPAIYSYSIDNMKQKITDMQELGYSQDDVIKMAKTLPAIYGFSIDNMKQKITDMQELGYSQDDVIKMAKTLPAIYGLSIDKMKQRIKFYDSIDMHNLAIVDAKQLMQGVALSYARYQFLVREQGVVIDIDNYKKLFVGQKRFKNKYGYDNNEIKQKYPYKEDK